MTTARAIAYLRVSTDKQADGGVSLDAQRRKVLAYADLYDLEITRIEVDAGASAKSLDRPALSSSLASLKAGEADALLVVKLDRLTRSVRDLGDLVELSNRQGWGLLSVSEQLDTRTAAGRMVLNILAAVSQWEREAIGERTAAAMAHKRANDEYTGGEAPYGWRVSDDGTDLEPNPEEQEAIAIARELRAAGLSLRKVGASLAARGVLPRTGKSWHPEKVKRLCAAKVAA